MDETPKPGLIDAVPANHAAFLADTKLHYRAGGFTFVHAGRENDELPIERVKAKVKMWTRARFYDSPVPWPGGRIIFGHTPFEKPLVTPSAIGIDTGAAYTGPLTAVRLPEVEFFQCC